jgi:hypothetical protein
VPAHLRSGDRAAVRPLERFVADRRPRQGGRQLLAGVVLLPTVSNKPRFTAEEKIDYFDHFLAGKPVGKIDNRFIQIDCNTAVDAGLYTFTFADGHIVKARYTYKWDGEHWLITSHHSSAMPEKY